MKRKNAANAFSFLLVAAGLAAAGHRQPSSNVQQNSTGLTLPDEKMLIFQHQGEGVPCDQMFTMLVDTADGKPATPKLVSTGKGRTTCGYFFPSGDRILFSSTHAASAECPPRPDYSKGYVWPVYDGYDIYTAKPDGSDLKQLTNTPGYDAE